VELELLEINKINQCARMIGMCARVRKNNYTYSTPIKNVNISNPNRG
jgi:hypothetical protein